MIYVACDHAGFELKQKLTPFLQKEYQVTDLGPFKLNFLDDYPDYAFLLAKKVIQDENNRGILICRTGNGMAIAANKVKGVRAAICMNLIQTLKSRNHNDANILVLAADFTPLEEMKKIINKFLETDFSGEERHIRRLKKISTFEEESRS